MYEVIDQGWLIGKPLFQVCFAEFKSEIRPGLQRSFDFGMRSRRVAELRLGYGREEVDNPVVRIVAQVKLCQRLSVSPEPVFINDDTQVIPAKYPSL